MAQLIEYLLVMSENLLLWQKAACGLQVRRKNWKLEVKHEVMKT